MISVFSVPGRSLPLGTVVQFFFPPILWRKSRQNVTLTASFCAIMMLRAGNALSPSERSARSGEGRGEGFSPICICSTFGSGDNASHAELSQTGASDHDGTAAIRANSHDSQILILIILIISHRSPHKAFRIVTANNQRR
jgi:hypothetical protein